MFGIFKGNRISEVPEEHEDPILSPEIEAEIERLRERCAEIDEKIKEIITNMNSPEVNLPFTPETMASTGIRALDEELIEINKEIHRLKYSKERA